MSKSKASKKAAGAAAAKIAPKIQSPTRVDHHVENIGDTLNELDADPTLSDEQYVEVLKEIAYDVETRLEAKREDIERKRRKP